MQKFSYFLAISLFALLSYQFYNINQTNEVLLNSNKNLFLQESEYQANKSFVVKKANDEILVKEDSSIFSQNLKYWILGVLGLMIFLYLYRWLSKPMPKLESKVKAKEIEDDKFVQNILPSKINLRLNDVAGMDDVKSEIYEIVEFLKDPKKYQEFGIKVPKGVLLIGPPGVGKTMIAKAIAGESGLPFFYQSGASFVQIYVGMGAKRVKELFDSAKREERAIIFIDEIDAVGKSRGTNGTNEEREATLNQLLIEMDGFDDNSNIMVIAATNQLEVLDEALLRPGRFDRRVHIPLPNKEDRFLILEHELKDKKYDLDIHDLVKLSTGFSGATLSTWVNEAALHALKRDAKKIEIEDFESVKQKVVYGKKRVLTLDGEDKQIQAIYQAAKALYAYYKDIDFDKVTILEENFEFKLKEIESKSDLEDRIKLYLCGKAATNVIFGDSFTNAKHDLKLAKELAKKMVEEYSMGENIVPNGADVVDILDESYNEVYDFILKHKKELKKIAKVMRENEFVRKGDLKELLD